MTDTQTKLIWGPTRIDGADAGNTIKLPGRRAGASCKNIVYFMRASAISSAGNPEVQLDVYHGPDGSAWASHSAVIALTEVSSVPTVVAGDTDADTNGQLGEWVQERVTVKSSAEYVMLEIYALAKPF